LGALEYIFEISKKQKNSSKPWVVRTDVTDMMKDPAHEKVDTEMAAPVLFLYFDASSAFRGAVICADKHKLTIDSCVSNAILCFVSIFHVCQVGYNDNWFNFLATLEHVLLGLEFKPTKYMPIKLEKFINGRKSK